MSVSVFVFVYVSVLSVPACLSMCLPACLCACLPLPMYLPACLSVSLLKELQLFNLNPLIDFSYRTTSLRTSPSPLLSPIFLSIQDAFIFLQNLTPLPFIFCVSCYALLVNSEISCECSCLCTYMSVREHMRRPCA